MSWLGRLGNAGRRTTRAVLFLAYYAKLFLLANAIVAWEIISPRSGLAPAVTLMPLRSRSPAEITCLAHLITLTPGTLVLEVGTDPPTLLVHAMHAADPERFRTQLGDLETRLLVVLRPKWE
jgi:multicomponent Na+:H+ antiporter subunit E